jgi:hypothetical protein
MHAKPCKPSTTPFTLPRLRIPNGTYSGIWNPARHAREGLSELERVEFLSVRNGDFLLGVAQHGALMLSCDLCGGGLPLLARHGESFQLG